MKRRGRRSNVPVGGPKVVPIGCLGYQIVWLEMFVPTSDLLDARSSPVEMIGVDGTRFPCKLEAFAATSENEAEVLLEYLVPVA